MAEDMRMIAACSEVLKQPELRRSLWLHVSGLADTMQAVEAFLGDHKVWLRGFQSVPVPGPGLLAK